MRLAYLVGYTTIMWVLIIIGGYILVRVVAPFHIQSSEIIESAVKAIIAISMVIAWVGIMILLKNTYVKRRLASEQ